MKKKIIITASVLLSIIFIWSVLDIVMIMISHRDLVLSLHSRSKYSSNVLDPKTYMKKSTVSLQKSFIRFLSNPFKSSKTLVYEKNGFIVCYATYRPEEGKWFLDITDEGINPPKVEKEKPKKKFNIFKDLIPQQTPQPEPTSRQENVERQEETAETTLSE